MRSNFLATVFIFSFVFFWLGNISPSSAASESQLNSVVVFDNPSDDFYITDGSASLLMAIADNDGANPPGWGNLDIVENVQHGVYANQGPFSQTFSYAPFTGFSGFDSFVYRYFTGQGGVTSAATVSILVIGNDDAQNAGSCPTRPLPNPSKGQPVNVTNGKHVA